MQTKIIRKIWIGKTIKEDSMSWHVGQTVRLGRNGETGVIESIWETEAGVYEISVQIDNKVVPWKKTSMDVTIEYDLVY